MENVYPELFDPLDRKFVTYHGDIRNPATNACLDTLGARTGGANIGAYPCHGQVPRRDCPTLRP